MNTSFTIIMTFCTTAHLVGTFVMGVLAYKRVNYLSLAWVLGLITVSLAICLGLFYSYEQYVDVGLMHPSIVLPMASSTYLETIYPLSLIMPGFLQWHRAVKYAMPLIVVVVGYFTGVMIVGHAPVLHTLSDIRDNLLLVPDVAIRLIAMGLSIYYIIGIIRLPRRMLRHNIEIPIYLKGYCSWLGITYILFIVLSFTFHWWLLYTVLMCITVINMVFMLQTIGSIMATIQRPKMDIVAEEPTPEVIDEVSREDFNEANLLRFRRAEHFMQTSSEWRDPAFTRDRLCEAVGFNRHLLLQCLRSQNYNNVHEYITTYRVEYLHRIVMQHPEESLTQVCMCAGFSTLVTARSAYNKILDRDLDKDWNR